MNRLHQTLLEKSKTYNSYHKHPNSTAFTWTTFVIAALAFTAILAFNLKDYANGVPSQAGFNTSNYQSILGDPGITDPDQRVLLYLPHSTQRIADCYNFTNPNGPGPSGNLITEADNTRTDWPASELALAGKCQKFIAGSSTIDWYHWSIYLGGPDENEKASVTHDWSKKDNNGNVITKFSGRWLPINGQSTVSSYATTIATKLIGGQQRRVWDNTLTSAPGNDHVIMFSPRAYEYRQILNNNWLEGNNIIWQAWVNLTQTVPSGSLGYRFASPELEGCWKFNGSDCTSDTSDIIRFFSIDMNPGHVDLCTAENTTNCPPFHIDKNGVKISKADTAHFPYSAYYFWCGPHTDASLTHGLGEKCEPYGLGAQEIVQIAPNAEWSNYGVPSSPLTLGKDTFLKFNIGAIADNFYRAQGNYPTHLRWNNIYVGAEMFSPNVTAHWLVSSFDVLKPISSPPPVATDTIKPVILAVSATPSNSQGPTIKYDISWKTDEPADSQIEYGTSINYGSVTPLDQTLVLDHSQSINGLQANKIYHYRIKSKDSSGNLAVSPDYLFNTAQTTNTDTTAPIITDITAQVRGNNQIVIVWRTNENSDSQVLYGTSQSVTSSTTVDTNFTRLHSALISNLNPGIIYYFRVKSKDSAGNVALSDVGSFKAGKDGGLIPIK